MITPTILLWVALVGFAVIVFCIGGLVLEINLLRSALRKEAEKSGFYLTALTLCVRHKPRGEGRGVNSEDYLSYVLHTEGLLK